MDASRSFSLAAAAADKREEYLELELVEVPGSVELLSEVPGSL